MSEIADAFKPDEIPEAMADGSHFEGWRIEDRGAADWVVRKVAKVRVERAEIDALFTREAQRLADWRLGEIARLDEREDRWLTLLRGWHQEQLAADPDVKTIRLPGGTLKAIAAQPSLDIYDPDAFVAWAKDSGHEEWIKTVPGSRTAIKPHLRPHVGIQGEATEGFHAVDDNGELVPGVALENVNQINYSVKVEL